MNGAIAKQYSQNEITEPRNGDNADDKRPDKTNVINKGVGFIQKRDGRQNVVDHGELQNSLGQSVKCLKHIGFDVAAGSLRKEGKRPVFDEFQ